MNFSNQHQSPLHQAIEAVNIHKVWKYLELPVSGGVKLDENRRFEIPGGFLAPKQRTGSFDCRFGAMVDANG